MMRSIKIAAVLFISTFTLKAQTLQDGLQALDYDRFEQARTIFTRLTQQEPTQGINFYYLGQTYTNLFRPDSARWAYTKGVNAEAAFPGNYAGLGELLLGENKVEEAKAQFNKALSISKGKDGRTKDINALIYVAAAMIASENKLVDDATALVDQGLENNKKLYDLYITAGDVYLERIDGGGKSATMYEKAIELDPKNPKAYVRVANIWLRVKNAEATFNELKRALDINPNYAPALKSLANYYYLTKQFTKAKETYLKYLDNSEPSIANKQRFARILFLLKEYDEALPNILDILKQDQSDVYMYRLAGYSYYEIGEAKKDTSMYRPGVEMMNTFIAKVDPKKVLSNDYEYLGKLYSRIPGEDSLAIYNINKAIETDPAKIELYKEAGMIYNKLRMFDSSIVYFERYIAVTPKVQLVDYQLLGLASYYGKQYAKTDSAYAKILEAKPDYADGYYWRGNANAQLEQDGKGTVAKENYEKYITLAEATPDKYKRNLLTAYKYLRYHAIQNDDNATAKLYNEKVLSLDAEDKEAKELQKQLK